VQTAYLVYYVDALLRKKELEDADNWLKVLEKAAPDLFDTVRLRAEYKFLHGEPEAAGDLAMGFLFNSKAQPSDRGQQLFLVAQVMEKFASDLASDGKNRTVAKALADKAGELYATLRNKRVSEMGELQYAGYLARQKRIRDFLDVIEQCWEQYPADALLLPSLQMIESKSATQAQYQQLEKILVKASKKTKGSVTLLLVLAKLHGLQQQDDKALADYREILAQSPRHFETMNNLAVGLARSGQNLDEALKLINDALAISGPRGDVLDSRTIIHIARKENDDALNDAQAAVKYDGTAEEYFHLAWAYWLAGKKSDAATAFTEAAKRGLARSDLDPSERPVYEQLKDGF